jgi:SAM-dependent methyltransferase
MVGVVERALTFGSVAGAYERFRPGYPDELVDLVLGYAGRPVRTALEIGAGTGKATRAFAARGIDVTATEPDEAMLEELRRHVPPTVTTVRSAFEDLPLAADNDLVYVAAALHWTRPEGRWDRVAGLLRPGGVFASFGGPVRIADPAVRAAAEQARSRFLETDEVLPPDGTPADGTPADGTSAKDGLQWPGSELARDPRFTDVRQEVVPRRLTMTAEDFVGHLTTVSAYLELPREIRTEAVAQIRAVLPDRVDVDADITAHLARSVTPNGGTGTVDP